MDAYYEGVARIDQPARWARPEPVRPHPLAVALGIGCSVAAVVAAVPTIAIHLIREALRA